MNQKKREIILSRFELNNPKPKIELIFNSTFELLVSVLLSAQSNDSQVNKITNNLYRKANTPEKMLEIGLENVKKYIKSIGLYNVKSNNIIKISEILVKKYKGVVPKNRKLLENFPGVGRKTANLVLNVAYGYPTIAVDRHIFRVCNRTNFASGKSVIEVEKKMIKVVPMRFKKNCHHWFVLHGRYVCRSKKLYCNACIIKDLCEFKYKKV